MKKKYLIIIIMLFSFQHSFSQNYQRTNLGIKSKAGEVQIEIQFFSPETVRILKSPEGSSFTKKSISVIKEPVKTDIKISEDENKISVQSSAVKVQLDTKTGKITYFNLQGEQLLPRKIMASNSHRFRMLMPKHFLFGRLFC